MPLETGTVKMPGGGRSHSPRKTRYPKAPRGMYGLQIIDVGTQTDTKYGSDDPNDTEEKFSFRVVIADPAMHNKKIGAKNDALYGDRSVYGVQMFINVRMVYLVPPSMSKGAESNLHKLLKNAWNGGDDLTVEQCDYFNEEPARLNELIGKNFLGMVSAKSAKDDEGQPMIVSNKVGAMMPAEEEFPLYQAPEWTPDERNFDPELNPVPFNEDLRCEYGEVEGGEDCNRLITGWENRKGEWVPQADNVEGQDAEFGNHFCVKHLMLMRDRERSEMPF